MKSVLLAVLFVLNYLNADFTQINTAMDNDDPIISLFGDFDNDDDLDLFISSTTASGPQTRIIRNDSGSFTENIAVLRNELIISADIGDYDNDGDLDVLVAKAGEGGIKIFRNNSGTFTEIATGISGYFMMNWADIDNDGDLDILNNGVFVYENNNGIYSLSYTLPYYPQGLVEGDYDHSKLYDCDNDGDQDIMLSGNRFRNSDLAFETEYQPHSFGYNNDNNSGEIIFSPDYYSNFYCDNLAIGDYDSDGDQDLLVCNKYYHIYEWTFEEPDTSAVSILYKNPVISGSTSPDITEVSPYSSASWGDIDNDGDLDIAATGFEDVLYGLYATKASIYKNNITSFNRTQYLCDMTNGVTQFGDIDNDSDLDLLIYDSKFYLYENSCAIVNNKPSTPSNLTAAQIGYDIILNWDKATDTETAQNGLSYNVYIGTQSGKCNIQGPLSNISNGYRKIVKIGNAGQINSFTIKGLVPGTYYWSVQAIDHCYAGSPFAPEQTVIVTGIEENIPLTTELYQNYPNPFNPETTIKYSLNNDAQVRLTVFDITGREVLSLVDKKEMRGFHEVKFDGNELTSGMYIYKLSVNDKAVASKKMMMIK